MPKIAIEMLKIAIEMLKIIYAENYKLLQFLDLELESDNVKQLNFRVFSHTKTAIDEISEEEKETLK